MLWSQTKNTKKNRCSNFMETLTWRKLRLFWNFTEHVWFIQIFLQKTGSITFHHHWSLNSTRNHRNLTGQFFGNSKSSPILVILGQIFHLFTVHSDFSSNNFPSVFNTFTFYISDKNEYNLTTNCSIPLISLNWFLLLSPILDSHHTLGHPHSSLTKCLCC